MPLADLVLESLTYHAMRKPESIQKAERLRGAAVDFARDLDGIGREPAGADRAVAEAYKKLEEALMWAIKAVARAPKRSG